MALSHTFIAIYFLLPFQSLAFVIEALNSSIPNCADCIHLDTNTEYYFPSDSITTPSSSPPYAIDPHWVFGCETVTHSLCTALAASANYAPEGSASDFLGLVDHTAWNWKYYTGCRVGVWVPIEIMGMDYDTCSDLYLSPMLQAINESMTADSTLGHSRKANRASINIAKFPDVNGNGQQIDSGNISWIMQL